MSKPGLRKSLLQDVRKLKAAGERELHRRGSMNSGNTVEVDYFALTHLICYFEETREAASRVVQARDALHQVFFSSGE